MKKFRNLHYIQCITVPHRTSRSINVVNEGTAVYYEWLFEQHDGSEAVNQRHMIAMATREVLLNINKLKKDEINDF